jgi:uncharacterized protein (DUF1501 family)
MEGLARLMTDGRLTVVQGVGYPNSSRDHERALRDWHSARPDEPRCPTGWLGRAIDGVCGPDPAAVPGVFVGPIAQPFALNARQAVVPSINSAADLTAVEETAPLAPVRPAEPNPLATYLRQCADGAAAMSRRIQATLRQTPAVDHYGQAGLAAQLKTVAQLIRANVGIRIFLVELGGGGLGGFDNHANQRDNHAALLKQFSDSTAAFADDLAADKLLDRVVLMTFSEFGRTVSENGRRGTDHGAAAPVFLVGGRLRPGLIGPRPNLTDLDQDAPRTQVDFRGLYATVLDRWLGLNSEAILGARFKPLDLFLP